jgi:hypothetical protein
MNKNTEAGGCESLPSASGPGSAGKAAARSSPSGKRIVPPTPAGTAAAIIGFPAGFSDGGRKPVTGQYPVPGRSPEMNDRIAAHEAGHTFLARALGSTVSFVTIVPGGGFDGRCVRSGSPSQLNLDENPGAKTEVVDIIARLEQLTPEIGSGRVESADAYVRFQVNCIELVGGRVCERVLYPDHEPLPAEHDQTEARAFAAVSCAAP